MLEPSPNSFIAPNAISTPTGSIRIATSALRTCSRNTMHTNATMMHSSSKRVLERVDGGVDQVGAVIDRHDLDRFRQAGRDLRKALLDVLNDVQRIDAKTLQHDAAGDLALAVELGNAAALVRPQFDAGDVPEQHRRAVTGLEHDIAEVVDAPSDSPCRG